MRTIVIDVSDKYCDAIAFTMIGGEYIGGINVAHSAFDLSKGMHFVVNDNGVISQQMRVRLYKEGEQK